MSYSKTPISGMGDRSPIGFISGGVLPGTKPRNPPVDGCFQARANRQLARSWLATIQPTPETVIIYSNALGQFGVGLTKAADLFVSKDLFLGKLQTVKQLIEP